MNIKELLNGITNWATNFIKGLLKSSKDYLVAASAIVNAIKEADAKNPQILDFIVSVIPSNVDDYLLAKLREKLPLIIVGMGYAEKVETALEEGIAKIQSLEPEYKATAFAALWIHIANILTDNGVSLKDLQKLQQTFYEIVGSKVVVTTQGDPVCIAPKVWNPIAKQCQDPIG